MSPRVSASKVTRIVAAYGAGKTIYEIVKEYGIHRVTVGEVLKREGVRMRRQSPTEAQVSEMIRLYSEGLSLKKVGDRLGFDAGTVHRRLKENSVTTSDSHRRR